MTAATPTKTKPEPSAIINSLSMELPAPWLPCHEEAKAAFSTADYAKVRTLAASNLTDSYCKALGYMCSIPKMPPTLAVLVAEAARAIAEAQKEAAIAKLNTINAEILEALK